MANLNLQDKKFITPENLKLIINYGLGFASRVKNLEDKEIAPFEADKLYTKDSLTIYDGYIYKAKVTNQSPIFNEIYWDLIGDDITELTKSDVEAMVGLSAEEIETLSKIILDSEVRLDKTFSSSKIYTDIQNAIQTSKDYTLTELSKISGASYKVVTSTGDMTDEKVIYLLQNGSNYDMYIVDSGTPVKIGDTTIDLSDYYTKTEIDNDFLKKADADGKFANITTVDNHISDTDIHTSADEKASYVKKTVADVPKTIITPSKDTEISLNTNCTYTVINGICYVSLWAFQSDATGQHILSTSLPKSKVVTMNMCSYGTEGNIGACVFLKGDNTGFLYSEINKTGQPLYGGFSYPVAES